MIGYAHRAQGTHQMRQRCTNSGLRMLIHFPNVYSSKLIPLQGRTRQRLVDIMIVLEQYNHFLPK